MTDLSPAAQTVLTAFGTHPIHADAIPDGLVLALAAALRAAADQVLAAKWQGQIQPDTTHMLGINWSRDALHAIAAELEGAND